MATHDRDDIKPLESNINVEVLDNTGKDDLRIVLFVWNSKSTIKGECIAWEVCSAKSPRTITVPASFAIEAKNHEEMCKSIAGRLGKCYEIHREKKDLPITIKEVPCTKAEDVKRLTVRNVRPETSYSGTPYDVRITRNSKLMLLHREVPVGKEITFEMTSIMNFGITRSPKVQMGEIFDPNDLLEQQEYNLRKFPKGVRITVKSSAGSNNYIFSADPM